MENVPREVSPCMPVMWSFKFFWRHKLFLGNWQIPEETSVFVYVILRLGQILARGCLPQLLFNCYCILLFLHILNLYSFWLWIVVVCCENVYAYFVKIVVIFPVTVSFNMPMPRLQGLTIDPCVSFPTGSTDCICFATVGTNDAVTSALHIILGE